MKDFRMTAKYKAALVAGAELGVPQWGGLDQEALYEALNKAGCFWNAKSQEWEPGDPAAADAPSDVVRVRVWAAADVVQEAAGQVRANLGGIWPCIEESRVYPCRPPKQADARVYLTFKPKKE